MQKIKKYILVILIIASILTIDQAIKLYVMNQENEIEILGGIVKITYDENTSKITTKNIIESVATDILVLVILTRFLLRQIENMNIFSKIAISFVLAGGFSNLIDKIIRRRVVNYINIIHFPIFNIAHIFIVLGFIIFAITVLIDLIKLREGKIGGNKFDKEHSSK